jgi:hypothetical protein
LFLGVAAEAEKVKQTGRNRPRAPQLPSSSRLSCLPLPYLTPAQSNIGRCRAAVWPQSSLDTSVLAWGSLLPATALAPSAAAVTWDIDVF